MNMRTCRNVSCPDCDAADALTSIVNVSRGGAWGWQCRHCGETHRQQGIVTYFAYCSDGTVKTQHVVDWGERWFSLWRKKEKKGIAT